MITKGPTLLQKLVQKYLRQFFAAEGRAPATPREWMNIQDDAVRELNKTKGVPGGPKKPWHQGWDPKVIQGGKGIESLLESGAVKKGVAPKTTKETLKAKKDKDLLLRDSEEDIARIKRENKQAIEDFKKKQAKKKTVEDLRDEGDWDPYGMASGGRIGYAAGKIVKGGKWFIKNLEQALKEVAEGTFKKELGPMEKEAFKWELKGLIGRIKMGDPLPDDMIQTIRNDPKFANITKTRSTDPDLYEFEDVILNYGKKGDVVDEQVEILEEFTPVGKGHASGGRVPLAGGKGVMSVIKMLLKKKPKSNKLSEQDVAALKKKHGLDPESLKKDEEAFNLRLQQILAKHSTKHAEGGRIGMMYGGDPGFAFEYGGSWADWHDQHRDQMPVEQYIKTKLPKHRLPFRELQSGGLAYMLGEPTYMKYGAGGSVGHAPWHKPTGQAQPTPHMDTPTPNVASRPDPMKAPRGLPSLAPKNMDPAYMQQQMMQKAMMGQGPGNTGQGPRPMANAGGRIGFSNGTPEIPKFEDLGIKEEKLHKMLEEYRRWKEDYEDKIMRAPKQDAAHGGRIGYAAGGFNAARRAFLKWLGGITGAGVVAGTGLLKLGSKAAPKVIKEAEVITRGADGMPSYITDLIQVVKAKGTRDIIEGFKRSDYSTVHRYKGVEVIDEAGGATRIKKGQEKSMYGSDEPSYHEVEMEIKPQYREQIDPDSGVSWYKDADGKKVYETKIPDEYAEYTAKPDMDGKLKDVEEFIDDVDHLELKKIADEKKTLFEDAVFKPDTLPGIFEKTKKTKKASGGLAHMLGE